MDKATEQAVDCPELSREVAAELPGRHLMATVSLLGLPLGLPLAGVSGVGVLVEVTTLSDAGCRR